MRPLQTGTIIQWSNTAVFVLWCLAVVFMPFHKVLSSPVLILSFMILALNGNYREKWQQLIRNKRMWWFVSIYLLSVYGYCISENTAAAAKDLQVKLYLVLIPVFMAMYGRMSPQRIRMLLQLFVISCILFTCTAITIAAYRFITTGENAFYYKYLVDFTFIHPSYVAMFMVFAMILIMYELITKWENLHRRKIMTLLCMIAILVLCVMLLTAKIAIASMFIALSAGFIIWGVRNLGWGKTLLIAVAGNILLFFGMLALPYTRERMLMLLHYNEVNYTNSVDSREQIWSAALDVGKGNAVFGIGSGDAEAALVEQYRANGFALGVTEKYNAHNAYLQIYVEAGLIGVAFFLLYLSYCLRWAWRDRNYVWLAFLLLFMLNIVTESMFKSQSGVVFFSFFNALLGLHSSRSNPSV